MSVHQGSYEHYIRHFPFLLEKKNLKLNGHPEYFGTYYS